MLPTCLSCHVKSNGMIAIHQHPNGLDEMFHSITGIEVELNDHLCVPCYDSLKSAHQFKQRCIQNNVVRLSGQASKTQAQVPIEQSANSNADVSTTCDDTRQVAEVGKVLDGHTYQEQSEKILEDQQQTNAKESAEEGGDHKDGSIEFLIDLVPAEEGIATEEKEEDFSLVNLESEEEENEESRPTDMMQQHEDHIEIRSPRSDEIKEEIQTTKPSPRLPKVHGLMCEFCFKEFKSLSEKIDHTASHQSEKKPFHCFHDGCSSSFKDRVGLRAHVRIHAVKRFGCRHCSMRFHTRGNRDAHERTHNGEKPFCCPKCGKGFAEPGNLKNHVRFHTGERPYQCNICNKSYRTHYSRSVHMRTHTNERPFVCDVCGKGFYSSGKLTIHRRIHTDERPYSCSSCDARFRDWCGLNRHQLKAH
uniref:C2H2-type domain-containing protein n=1 Tax=Anopheles atroparvus TaxID=41427 RepID=A0AAG5CTH4_ANOAO